MASNFVPSPPEIALVNTIFSQADPQKLGVITGEVAVKVFAGSRLPANTLGEIWNVADEDNNGWLGKKGVAIAIRLIGWAQKGEKVSSALISKQGPLPTIDGVTAVAQQSTGISLPRSPPPGLPALTPQDKARFASLFKNAGPVNGLLSAERARDTFMKSKLPHDTLGKIWALADTQDRGSLDVVDFTIGMYCIQGIMKGQISSVPSVLPPGLYQQAGGNFLPTQITGGSGSFSPVASSFVQSRPSVQPQYTGQNSLQQHLTGASSQLRAPQLPARPTPSAAASPFSSGNGHVIQWDVTPTEKVTADSWFAGLDHLNQGFIGGEVAVEFMRQSKLPDEILAKIWDLSDLNGDGKLTKEGFAVAMHLIQKKLAGVEVPDILPSTLIPPSLRAASPPPSEHVPDLFSWDDTPSTSTPATSIIRQETGRPLSASPAHSPQPAIHDPFNSTSPVPFSHRNFLDDDGDTPIPIHDHSADIGNLRNQLNSTQQSLDTAKAERSNLEKVVENQSGELATLQTQLATAKASYETETKLLSTLRDRHANQAADIQKVKGELIRAESELSAIRVEKAEIEGAFLRDKEEVRDLNRKMIEASQQTESFKAETEKLRKDAKQQKGLLAIARKQLSTKEADRAKATQELEEVQAEVTLLTKEQQELESQLADSADHPSTPVATNLPGPIIPEPLALTALSTKSNNPFDRLAVSTSSPTPRSQSPFSASFTQPNNAASTAPSTNFFDFDSVFATDNIHTPLPIQHLTPSISDEVPQLDEATPVIDSDAVVSPPVPTSAGSKIEPSAEPSKSPLVTDALDTSIVTEPLSNSEEHSQATDLGTDLKELDLEDFDSDSDSEDEVPLAELAKQKSSDSAAANLPVLQDATPKFNDIFGGSDLPPAAHNSSDIGDVFGISPPSDTLPSLQSKPQDEDSTNKATSNIAAGVNAFDEAMGKIPSQTQPTLFETAFEDNFDFPPLAAPLSSAAILETQSNGHTNGHQSLADVHPIMTPPPPSTISPAASVIPDTSRQSPNGHNSVLVGTPPGPQANPTVHDVMVAVPQSSSAPSVSSTPTKGSPHRTDTRSSSPLSPPIPPRTASPKPRPSTSSSSKEGHEKPKDVPTRHSKLSIRLPFGKRKHKAPQEPMPPPPSHLPVTREEARSGSPALDDDVEGVKQLTSMGFSRSVAVTALETNGYDLQKALNSLL
ncbi:hypothetical protein BDN72DRAFT_888746 [Pluteus cervinus]|uniref:Uncharacterized protein n=1 Tax=Pluteus cervinus TaxID=181527 RepID=A0ACD3AQR4_9AGAR|nr:hypothetical protein BDN72DRAFT_888746 [Pluteus cervinus]